MGEAEWLIWAYSSAAPPFIGKHATVMDGAKVLRKGTNGWTCVSANPHPPETFKEKGWDNAHQSMPVCGDKNAFDWIGPYAKTLGTGKLHIPEMKADGWAWMLQGDMGEDNNVVGKVADAAWGKEHPDNWIMGGTHLMMLPKDPEVWAGYNSDFATGGPYIMFPDDEKFGNHFAHMMIPHKDYYHYQAKDSPSGTVKPEPEGSHKSEEWLIWALSSAAPPFLAEDIYVINGKDKEGKDIVLKEKPENWNGFTCMPANPWGPQDKSIGWRDAHEMMPACFDENGAKWIWPYAMGKKTGPENEVDGWAWMLHGDMGEDNNVVGKVGDFKWGTAHKKSWIQGGPHLMLLPAKGTQDAWESVTSDFSKGDPYVMFKKDLGKGDFGNLYAHIMIPFEGYFHYQDIDHGLNKKVLEPVDPQRKFMMLQGGELIPEDGLSSAVTAAPFCAMGLSLLLAGLWVWRGRSSARAVSAQQAEAELEALSCPE